MTSRLERLARPMWDWMDERHGIYIRRQLGHKPPFTKDPVLQKFRFCNVFRELDTVTKWIRTNWRDPMAEHRDLWFAMLVARMINWPSTLEELGQPRTNDKWLDHAARVLDLREKGGQQIYGPAYIITAGGRPGRKWEFTMECFRAAVQHKPLMALKGWIGGVEEMHTELTNLLGVGRFIGYEIATDLRWTRYYDGSDHLTWANPGPGALRGLSRLLHGSLGHKPSIKDGIELIADLTAIARQRKFKHIDAEVLEARDIEHSLCETDKYLRAKSGDGRPKALFRPS